MTAGDSLPLRPVAFMAMPFGKRKLAFPPPGAPLQVDFDRLWNEAFHPALSDAGYMAIRADVETGTVIVKDMLERLALADLVLADVTLPNGNVYYETGIRHAARETGCILIGAEWSDRLFDLDQIRTQPYPLTDGSVPAGEADTIRAHVAEIVKLHRNARTPFHELVRDKGDSSVFRDQMQRIATFQSDVHEIELSPKNERPEKLMQLRRRLGKDALRIPEVALELLRLVTKHVSNSWSEVDEFVAELPEEIRERPFVREQQLLATAKLGNSARAIAGLGRLIVEHGETPERWGLLGGRHKELWRKARAKREGKGDPGGQEKGHLNDAIDAYRHGVLLDLNEYYCASNLPLLLRARGRKTDRKEADFVDELVTRVCRNRIETGSIDGWEKPTLLGSAFRAGDVEWASDLADEVEAEGPGEWQVESTANDLRDALDFAGKGTRKRLKKVLDRLEALVEAGKRDEP